MNKWIALGMTPFLLAGGAYAAANYSGLTTEEVYDLIFGELETHEVRLTDVELTASTTAQEVAEVKQEVASVKTQNTNTQAEVQIVKETVVIIQEKQASTTPKVEEIETKVAAVEQKVAEVETQVEALTPPPLPPPPPEPEPEPVVWNVTLTPIVSPDAIQTQPGLSLPLFETSAPLKNPKITVTIAISESGLDFGHLELGGVRLVQGQGGYEFPEGRNIEQAGTISLTGFPYESYPYPDYTLTVTITSVENSWVCTEEYDSCSFPSFPTSTSRVINPRIPTE